MSNVKRLNEQRTETWRILHLIKKVTTINTKMISAHLSLRNEHYINNTW